MTAKIVIKVKVPEAQKFKTLEEKEYKKYRFDKTGIYTVEYSVANPNNTHRNLHLFCDICSRFERCFHARHQI